MIVNIILEKNAKMPVRAHRTDAGFDIYTSETIYVPAHKRTIVPTGIRIQMKDNRPRFIRWIDRLINGEFCYEALIDPRSGLSAKGMEGMDENPSTTPYGIEPARYRYDCDVIEGKIDMGYTDHIGVILDNKGRGFFLPKGLRIAQMTFVRVACPKFVEVKSLEETDRQGGFGSTGL